MKQGRRCAIALLCSAGFLASTACIPSPDGECARDADCAHGEPGSFCAEGICQGAPQGTLEIPAGPVARNATLGIRVHLIRAHGGFAGAHVRLEANGARVPGTQDVDGTLHINAPLAFAPANAEGPTPFVVIVSDDLGHETTLPGSVFVDDEGPRITVAQDSLPTAPVLRGTIVALRVLLTDEASSSLQSSISGGPWTMAQQQLDGSFRVEVDSARSPAASTAVEVELLATDALGNSSRSPVAMPLTRVRWRAGSQHADAIVGMTLTDHLVIATTQSGVVAIIDRATGSRTDRAPAAFLPTGNLVNDGTSIFTARADGSVCKLDLDGGVVWCCSMDFGIAGPLALGPMPQADGASPAISTVLIASHAAASEGRLYAIREGIGAACDFRASTPLAHFLDSGPAIAPDGSVYAGATLSVAVGRFDGLAWTAQAFARATNAIGQPAFAEPLLGDEPGMQRVLFGTDTGELEDLLFPAPSAALALPAAPTSISSTAIGAAASSTPVLAADGTAFVSTRDQRLAAIALDGTPRWNTTLSAIAAAGPVVGAAGIIYSAGTDGTLSSFSTADGGLIWSFSATSPITTAPSPGCDSALYFGTRSGEVISLAADAPGLASSLWPMGGHDVRGTGDSRRPLRDADGGCLE